MLLDFRNQRLAIYPSTCPRSLVFRVQARLHDPAVGVFLLMGTQRRHIGHSDNGVVDDRSVASALTDGVAVVEWKIGEILRGKFPRVGSNMPLQVCDTKLTYNLRLARAAVSGGIKLLFEKPELTIFCEDFAEGETTRTPIEIGTFAREEERPAQTSWARLVSDEDS